VRTVVCVDRINQFVFVRRILLDYGQDAGFSSDVEAMQPGIKSDRVGAASDRDRTNDSGSVMIGAVFLCQA
jgi:hypothetical protein